MLTIIDYSGGAFDVRAAEKVRMIQEPVLRKLEGHGAFARGRSVWYINKSLRFLVFIEPILSSRGYFLSVCVGAASFYRGISITTTSKSLVLGDDVKYDVEPSYQEIIQLASVDDIDHLCMKQKDQILNWLDRYIIPAILQISSYADYLRFCEDMGKLRHPTQAPHMLAWDYLGVGDRQRAYEYLDYQINKPIWEELGIENTQECIRERTYIQALRENELSKELEKRLKVSDEACRAYFGERRWKQCDGR